MLLSHHGCFPACSESRVESGARMPDSRCGQRWLTLRHSARLDCIFPRNSRLCDRPLPAGEPVPDGNLMPAGLICSNRDSAPVGSGGWVFAEDRRVVERSEPVRFYRWPLQAAWMQLRVTDSDPRRDKSTRVCVARADRTQALVILDFPSVDEPSVEGAWQTLMDTIVVGDYIADPATGKRRMQRG